MSYEEIKKIILTEMKPTGIEVALIDKMETMLLDRFGKNVLTTRAKNVAMKIAENILMPPISKHEVARTDPERAMSHYGMTQEEWDETPPEEQERLINELPPRGSFEEYSNHIYAARREGISQDHSLDQGGPHTHQRGESPVQPLHGKPTPLIGVTLPDQTYMEQRLISGLRQETFMAVPFKHIGTDEGSFIEPDFSNPLFKENFRWMHGKKYRIPLAYKGKGHLYAFRTLNMPMTLNGAKWTVEEKRLAARTLINAPVNLDHEYHPKDPNTNLVIDAEYEDGWIEGFDFVTDKKINDLYEGGHIIGVSVEYYPRHDDWANGWNIEGARFVGLAHVSDKYMMGAPESILTRVETRETGEDNMSKPKEEKGIERNREEVLAEIKDHEDNLVALRAELSAFEPPSKEAIELRVTTLESKLTGISKALDRIEETMKKELGDDGEKPEEVEETLPEPRKETLVGYDDGEEFAEELSSEDVAEMEPSVLNALRRKQFNRDRKLGNL